MKLAFLNDTHCGIRNSSDIWIEYQRRFYEDIFFPYLRKHNIKNIIHLGDYYDHRKYINFKALNENRKMFLDVLVAEQITMDIIPGNHDVFYKNTNELSSLKELMGHYMNNINIVMKPTVLDYDGTKIGLVPWVNNDNYAKTAKFLKNCKARFIGGHFELAGFQMMRGVTNHHGMDSKLLDRFEQVWTGHFHTKSTTDNINYFGSQMEFTWADAHDQKYFHTFDTETSTLEAVENPITLFEKVVYNDEKIEYNDIEINHLKDKYVKIIVDAKTDHFQFDRFVDRIQSLGVHDLKIAETFEEFTGAEIDDNSVSVEDTATLLNSYVDAVTTDLDKNRIKGLMNELYIEASNLEVV